MKWHWKKSVDGPSTLVEFVAVHCDLSKTTIKKVLTAGGAWVAKGGKGTAKRCRKATQPLAQGDRVEFYFDEQVLQPVPEPELIRQNAHFGIWYKPVNVLAQGSPYGDAGAMDRQVQTQSGKAQVFLIHRLDREAAGLMVFAYSKAAAAKLSSLWSAGAVRKVYQAEVLGLVECTTGEINLPLDDKAALTRYRVHGQYSGNTLVAIEISTGRYHQIRRHFAAIGHPLLGDPRYGQGNKDSRGLRLVASRLEFTCPFTRQPVDVTLPETYRLF